MKAKSKKTSLTSVKASLNAKDICDIVEMCAKSSVLEFSFGQLHITFGSKAKSQALTEPQWTQLTDSQNPEDEKTQTGQLTQSESRNSLVDKELLRITDPEEWERQELEEPIDG